MFPVFKVSHLGAPSHRAFSYVSLSSLIFLVSPGFLSVPQDFPIVRVGRNPGTVSGKYQKQLGAYNTKCLHVLSQFSHWRVTSVTKPNYVVQNKTEKKTCLPNNWSVRYVVTHTFLYFSNSWSKHLIGVRIVLIIPLILLIVNFQETIKAIRAFSRIVFLHLGYYEMKNWT